MAHVMVDVDDVVFPMLEKIHEAAERALLHDGTGGPLAAWRGWEHYGCTEEEFWEVWNDFRDSGGYLDTEPIDGVVAALADVVRRGHVVHLVTARGCASAQVPGVDNDYVRAVTRAWVERVRLPHHTLTFIRRKPDAQAELGVRFDFAFDDHPGNVAELRADGVRAFLVTQPHNEHDPAAINLPRARDLADGLRWCGLISRDYLCRHEAEHDLEFVMTAQSIDPLSAHCSRCGAGYSIRRTTEAPR